MAALIFHVVGWPTLGIALLVFGFAPGALLRLIVLLYPRSNLRRRELIGELYAVPRLERPFWVAEQLEVALFEGLYARFKAWSIARIAFWIPMTFFAVMRFGMQPLLVYLGWSGLAAEITTWALILIFSLGYLRIVATRFHNDLDEEILQLLQAEVLSPMPMQRVPLGEVHEASTTVGRGGMSFVKTLFASRRDEAHLAAKSILDKTLSQADNRSETAEFLLEYIISCPDYGSASNGCPVCHPLIALRKRVNGKAKSGCKIGN